MAGWWSLLQGRIWPLGSAPTDEDDGEEGAQSWRQRIRGQNGDPMGRDEEEGGGGSQRTDRTSTDSYSQDPSGRYSRHSRASRASRFGSDQPGRITYAEESLPPLEAWTLPARPAYLPYEAPTADDRPGSARSSSRPASGQPATRPESAQQGERGSRASGSRGSRASGRAAARLSGQLPGQPAVSAPLQDSPFPHAGQGSHQQQQESLPPMQEEAAHEPHPPEEGVPRPVRRSYWDLIKAPSRPNTPPRQPLPMQDAAPLQTEPAQGGRYDPTDIPSSGSSASSLDRPADNSDSNAVDGAGGAARTRARPAPLGTPTKDGSMAGSTGQRTPLLGVSTDSVGTFRPHLADAKVDSSLGSPRSHVKFQLESNSTEPLGSAKGSMWASLVANKAAAGSGSPSRVLFRPAPVLIPDGSEERPTDSISPGKTSMGGMLSKKFRGAVMGISMVRSLLGRSTGNMSPGAGNGGDTESFEGGFSKIVSRVKSSLALASPMGNGKSVVLNGNNDAFDYNATLDLLQAVKSGEPDKVGKALAMNADPNWGDPYHHGMTPMHYVASLGRFEAWHPEGRFSEEIARTVALMLKKAGARMNTPDSMSFVPLQLAAYHGNITILNFILQSAGRSRAQLSRLLSHQDSHIKNTALHCAVEGHQIRAVQELLQYGASYRVQDYTSLTPWSLCAHHHRKWGQQLMSELNLSLATHGKLPADAVLQLALDLRTLEAVPVVLRAAAKWPDQVWQLMRAAIASGLQEFVQLLAEDLPTVCPEALLEVPWGDVMVELATRFPTSFQSLIVGLNSVDFESYVLPFIDSLSFDTETPEGEAGGEASGAGASGGAGERGGGPGGSQKIQRRLSMELKRLATPSRNINNTDLLSTAGGSGAWSMRSHGGAASIGPGSNRSSAPGSDHSPKRSKPSMFGGFGASRASSRHGGLSEHGAESEHDRSSMRELRLKSVVSLKSMLVPGRSMMDAGMGGGGEDGESDGEAQKGGAAGGAGPGAEGEPAQGGLPEAVKYLLLRCLVASLNELDWRVWQAFVGGLHGSLALEVARFPKLFKRLTDSIAARVVPDWKEVAKETVAPALKRTSTMAASAALVVGTGGSAPRMSDLVMLTGGSFRVGRSRGATANGATPSGPVGESHEHNTPNKLSLYRTRKISPEGRGSNRGPAVGGGSNRGPVGEALEPGASSKWDGAGELNAATLITSTEAYEAHKLLNLNHIVAAAIASRSNVNVYNIITAMDRWLELNPTCYLAHLDPENVAALAGDYPDACRLLLSFEAQGQADVKVPGYLCDRKDKAAYRCNELALAFIWQDDGLVALKQLGINDLERVQRWILSDVTFDAVLKMFKSSAQLYPATDAAHNLEALLNSGLTGKDINKLVQLDTDLADVRAALKGGLSAGFVHQMLTKRISFQVVTEMLGVMPNRNTLWNNVRHQPVWNRFPPSSYQNGITYEFIRLFFETWEEYNFDKRFIDLLFDFHDPLFVKLRTALEYVNSNKAFHVSLAEEEQAIQLARQNRALHTLSILSEAFLTQQHASPHRLLIVAFVYGGAVLLPKVVNQQLPRYFSRMVHYLGLSRSSLQDTLHESPKLDALSETLPITNLAQLGKGCYLRALLSAGAPASTFGLPVVEAIIQVKWSTYGFLFHTFMLLEQLLHIAVIIAYAALYAFGDTFCLEQFGLNGSDGMGGNGGGLAGAGGGGSGAEGIGWNITHLFNCSNGIAILFLDGWLVVMCVYETSVYVRQLLDLGPKLWGSMASNWINITQVSLFQASVAMLVLLHCLKLGWFAILNERLGALVRIITQTFSDTLYFLFLLTILYVGFFLAFLTLAPREPADDGSAPLTGRLLSVKLFTMMLGDVTSDFLFSDILGTFAIPTLSLLLMIGYAVMLLIVAFNMLVAIMNDTFNRIRGAEKDELLKLKALVLVDLEAGFTRRQLDGLNKQLMGKYLHSLKPKMLEQGQDDNNQDVPALISPNMPHRQTGDRRLVLETLFNDWDGGSPVRSNVETGDDEGVLLRPARAGASSVSRPGSAARRTHSHANLAAMSSAGVMGVPSRPLSSRRTQSHISTGLGGAGMPARLFSARRRSHAPQRPMSTHRSVYGGDGEDEERESPVAPAVALPPPRMRPKSAFRPANAPAAADYDLTGVDPAAARAALAAAIKASKSRAVSRAGSRAASRVASRAASRSVSRATSFSMGPAGAGYQPESPSKHHARNVPAVRIQSEDRPSGASAALKEHLRQTVRVQSEDRPSGASARVGFAASVRNSDEGSFMVAQRSGASSSRTAARSLSTKHHHNNNSTDEALPQVLRDAKRRVTRMMTTKAARDSDSSIPNAAFLTPAEALQVQHDVQTELEEVEARSMAGDGGRHSYDSSGSSGWDDNELLPVTAPSRRVTNAGGYRLHDTYDRGQTSGRFSNGNRVYGGRVSLAGNSGGGGSLAASRVRRSNAGGLLSGFATQLTDSSLHEPLSADQLNDLRQAATHLLTLANAMEHSPMAIEELQIPAWHMGGGGSGQLQHTDVAKSSHTSNNGQGGVRFVDETAMDGFVEDVGDEDSYDSNVEEMAPRELRGSTDAPPDHAPPEAAAPPAAREKEREREPASPGVHGAPAPPAGILSLRGGAARRQGGPPAAQSPAGSASVDTNQVRWAMDAKRQS